MNIESLDYCWSCGIVVNVNQVNLEPYSLDHDGDIPNPNVVIYQKEPVPTWRCPVCKELNGILPKKEGK